MNMLRIQHPEKVEGIDELVDESIESKYMTTNLLVEILNELKKINTHLQSITEEEIDNDY